LFFNSEIFSEYIKRMPYKYIGRRTDFRGKTLWEIVGNLKNFGIGRIVVRSRFERYQEPSYLKIVKVEPLPCPEVQNMDVSMHADVQAIIV
jgi:small subunit ribosomal protein S34